MTTYPMIRPGWFKRAWLKHWHYRGEDGTTLCGMIGRWQDRIDTQHPGDHAANCKRCAVSAPKGTDNP